MSDVAHGPPDFVKDHCNAILLSFNSLLWFVHVDIISMIEADTATIESGFDQLTPFLTTWMFGNVWE